MSDDDEERPFRSEHACRLRDPGEFERLRRQKSVGRVGGKRVDHIIGFRSDGGSERQAIRYPLANGWDEATDEAREHCRERGGSFEAARQSSAADSEALLRSAPHDPQGREIRRGPGPPAVTRQDDDVPVLAGHAAVFNRQVNILNIFREEIAPGAFKQTLADGADVRHLFNHDVNHVLARTKSGTLDLAEDSEGLAFEARLNTDDPEAMSVAAKVERGDVDQSSFAFKPVKDEWDMEPDDGGIPKRRILEVKLFDTSTVTFPAYEDAESFLKSTALDELTRALGLTGEQRDQLIDSLTSGRLGPDDAAVLRAAEEALAELRSRAGEEPPAPPSTHARLAAFHDDRAEFLNRLKEMA